jgi:hypothetical protein
MVDKIRRITMTIIPYLEMEAAWSSKMQVFYHTTTWCHNPEDCKLKPHLRSPTECLKLNETETSMTLVKMAEEN